MFCSESDSFVFHFNQLFALFSHKQFYDVIDDQNQLIKCQELWPVGWCVIVKTILNWWWSFVPRFVDLWHNTQSSHDAIIFCWRIQFSKIMFRIDFNFSFIEKKNNSHKVFLFVVCTRFHLKQEKTRKSTTGLIYRLNAVSLIENDYYCKFISCTNEMLCEFNYDRFAAAFRIEFVFTRFSFFFFFLFVALALI